MSRQPNRTRRIPTDSDRIDFIAESRLAINFDHDSKSFDVSDDEGNLLASSVLLRAAMDDAMIAANWEPDV